MKVLLGMFSLLLPLLSMAQRGERLGGVSGGGGYVVACYENDNLKSVELLDLYEGRVAGLEYEKFNSMEEGFQKVSKKLYKTRPSKVERFLRDLVNLQKIIKYIPQGARLEPTDDALPVFRPRNCKFEQVANYYNSSLLWIDRELYEKMSLTDKIALAVHEVLFAEERENGFKNSRYTRRVTAYAMSAVDVFDPYKQEGEAWYCYTKNMHTEFRLFKQEEKDTYTLSFSRLNRHEIFTRKTAKDLAIHRINKPGDYETEQNSPLTSAIDSDEEISIWQSYGKMYLSWKGVDPGDRIDDKRVNCYKR